MATTTAVKRTYEAGFQRRYWDFIAAAALVEGAAVSQQAGENSVRDLNVADAFAGFVARAAASGAEARVVTKGLIRGLAVTGATTTTAQGATVYATDNDTFTLTASGALAIGRVVRGTGTNTADVEFEGASMRSV